MDVAESVQSESAAGRVPRTGEWYERRLERLNMAPRTAPAGLVKLNLWEPDTTSGIFAEPSGFSPPRFATPATAVGIADNKLHCRQVAAAAKV